MKWSFTHLSIVLILVVAGCSARPEMSGVDRTPTTHDWERKTLSSIKAFLSEPKRETIAKETERFLVNPMLSVQPATEDKPWIEALKQYAENASDLASIVWDDSTIGTLRCGIGGGYSISVVFHTKTGRQKAVVVVPGE